MPPKKIFAFDIDGTICTTIGSDYTNSVPLVHRITRVNELFDSGIDIVYFSARGSSSGKDLYEFTYNQLISWGCKFSKLILGKPAVDIFIDDKAISDKEFFHGQN